MLTSKQNPRLKYVRRLAKRKFRENEDKFLIEGVRFIEEAIKSGWALEMVIHTPLFKNNSSRGSQLLDSIAVRKIPILSVDEKIFVELADTESPQGLLAVAKKPQYPGPEIFCRDNDVNLIVLVDGIRDPGNLGTIIRSSDAAGAQAVFLLQETVDLYNAKTLRSTMGSIFHIPILNVSDWQELSGLLIAYGWKLVAGDPANGIFLPDCNLKGRIMLVVGSEAKGISPAVRGAAHEIVRIPMPGRAESLNAGVAVGIMLYETIRQKHVQG